MAFSAPPDSPAALRSPLHTRLRNLRAHERLLLATLLGGVGAWLAPGHFDVWGRLVVFWDVFSVAFLALIWVLFATADAAHIRRVATTEDPGRLWTFVLVIGAAFASLLGMILLLGSLKEMMLASQITHVLLAVGAVLLAWFHIHTVFTMRYAHLYFSEVHFREAHPAAPATPGSLLFSGTAPATYWDFAYFAFGIGMTAQTADVGIGSQAMRKLVLLHALLAFSFNTAVVALSINILSGIR